MMFTSRNFVSRELMKELKQYSNVCGSYVVLQKDGRDEFAVTIDSPIDEFKKLGYEYGYQTADLNDLLIEGLPDTICVKVEGTDEFRHYYSNIKHYYRMVTYTNDDYEGALSVFKAYTGNTLIETVANAIIDINKHRVSFEIIVDKDGNVIS